MKTKKKQNKKNGKKPNSIQTCFFGRSISGKDVKEEIRKIKNKKLKFWKLFLIFSSFIKKNKINFHKIHK